MSLEFVEASAEALPFDDSSFDAVTIAFGLRNVRCTLSSSVPPSHQNRFSHSTQVTHTSKALGEFLRVLKKGGRFM